MYLIPTLKKSQNLNFKFQGVQVRARPRVQCHLSAIKLQEGQGGTSKEDQEIKTAAEDPTGSEAANHEKGAAPTRPSAFFGLPRDPTFRESLPLRLPYN